MTTAMRPPRPRGRPRAGEERRKAQVTVVFDPQDLARLDGVARQYRLPVSSLMRMWVMQQVEQEERGTG